MAISLREYWAGERKSLIEAGRARWRGPLLVCCEPFTRTDGRQSWHVRLWAGKAGKPFANYQFATEAAANSYIAEQVERNRYAAEAKAERKAAEAAEAAAMRGRLTVGAILCYSWGWEQTNVDYYQVVAVKGASVVIRPIAAETVPGTDRGGMCCDVRPVPGAFTGGPITKRVAAYGVKMAHGHASPVEPGSKHYCSWYA